VAQHFTKVPIALSVSLAARLAGVSRATFRARYLLPGLCHVTTDLDDILHGVGVGCVWCWELEAQLSRRFTVEEVQAADCALDRPREGQRSYRKRQGRKRAA
jgi:hypothetical protein